MKELSIEEKAKKYDEAIRRAKGLLSIENNKPRIDDILGIFPELEDNKDEKIRKELLDAFQKSEDSIYMILTPYKRKSFIDWLEKQGEQKPAWSEDDEIALGDALWCCKQAASIAKDENDMGNAWYAEDWLKHLKDRVLPQPKQECSEEDENNILFLTAIIEECFKDKEKITLGGDTVCANFTKENVIERLKSLKPHNGYNPYKKVVESIAEMCKHYDKASHSNLRDFYDNVKVKCKDAKEYDSLYPNSTWKPSDEQMADLWNMVCECRPADQQLLQDIYYGLKTLRGE